MKEFDPDIGDYVSIPSIGAVGVILDIYFDVDLHEMVAMIKLMSEPGIAKEYLSVLNPYEEPNEIIKEIL